jgi:hypothetical protein
MWLFAVATVSSLAAWEERLPHKLSSGLRFPAVKIVERCGAGLLPDWLPRSWESLPSFRWRPVRSGCKSARHKQRWIGHWELESSEDDKAEAVMKAEGVPFVARKVAMRFKPERRVPCTSPTLSFFPPSHALPPQPQPPTTYIQACAAISHSKRLLSFLSTDTPMCSGGVACSSLKEMMASWWAS